MQHGGHITKDLLGPRGVPVGGGGGTSLPESITDDFTTDSGLWLDGDLAAAAITVSGGKGIWTPTYGAELLTNGDFSTWTGDNPDDWIVNFESGADPEVTERAPDAGHADAVGVGGAANFYSSVTNYAPAIRQNDVATAGKPYIVYYHLSKRVANRPYISYPFSADWLLSFNKYVYIANFVSASYLIFGVSSVAPADFTVDSISLKEVLFSNSVRVQRIYYPSYVEVSCRGTIGYQSTALAKGVILLKDASNFILTIVGPGRKAQIWKRVAGTTTLVATVGAIIFSNDDIFRLTPNAAFTEFSFSINAVEKIAPQTINDFAGVSGPWYAGMFNTYDSGDVAVDSFDNFSAVRIDGSAPF